MAEGTVTLPAARPVNWVWGAVVICLAATFGPSLAYIGLYKYYSWGYPGLPGYLPETAAASVALLLALLIFSVYDRKESLGLGLRGLFQLRPFGRSAAVFAAGAAADLAVTALLLLAMHKYSPDQKGSPELEKMWTAHANWFFAVLSTVMYACCEELVLRGLVLNYVRKYAGFLKALLVSSLLFALLHVGRSWLALLLIFLNGVVYGLAYERTRSLAVPCLLHGLHNSALRVVLILGLFS